MDPQTVELVVRTLQTTAIVSVIFAACAFIPRLHYRAQIKKLPALTLQGDTKARNDFIISAKKLYKEGYSKFRDSVFTLINESGKENFVIPPCFLPELRKLPENVLNLPLATSDVLEAKYTKFPIENHAAAFSVRAKLTPALQRLNAAILQDVNDAIETYLPPCNDWTEVNVNEKLIRIISKVSGGVFVGRELARDLEYLDLSCFYAVELTNAVASLKKLPPWLKPFLASRTPEIIALRAREKQTIRVLRPIVKGRMVAKANDPNWQEPDDVLQWLINESNGTDSVETLATVLLALIFGATHTTTITLTSILYTLAVTPEYVEPLRQEICNVLAEEGGTLTFRGLQKLKKLDSYMKEVLRFYGPFVTSFTRRTLKGITLSNGQYIPAGVMIEVPTVAVYQDELLYPSSGTFDGFRAYKTCSTGNAADIARNQFATSNEENLTFGYGRHACPGRFYAANEIKMILARLILDYDIKMPNNERERHAQIDVGKISLPDPTKMLAFKKVAVERGQGK
ncbi:hypothetical protein COCCADRAFT_10237 [Bipolaris zeicola 26-R-13]|uniref:Cytochrome P450 monooxygenase n=1 Tax=Cochliobolus carbonum (strain 26-R-13) TaxID=930089 RepID=W6XNG2_COCC2|nr:uncharacterized protein COCCADRAFT_10237 [Bipolaris zeicola 26-R-13]EUC27053.1 hypothetical protein COCCADRAFT_10237 [Bipolaris zeicola 26-R-13]